MDRTKRACERLHDPLPQFALDQAYRELLRGGRVTAGGSTACVLMLDKSSGVLHSANLGDTGYLVMRRSDQQAYGIATENLLLDNRRSNQSYAPRLFPEYDAILMDHLNEENAIMTATVSDDSHGCPLTSEDDSLSVGASSVSTDTTTTLTSVRFGSVSALLNSSAKSSLPYYRPIHQRQGCWMLVIGGSRFVSFQCCESSSRFKRSLCRYIPAFVGRAQVVKLNLIKCLLSWKEVVLQHARFYIARV